MHHLDMEAALLAAFRDVLPGVNYKFCNFHVTKAVIKRCEKLRLGVFLRGDVDFKRWVCSFANLAYLPPHLVQTGMNALGVWLVRYVRRIPPPFPTVAIYDRVKSWCFLHFVNRFPLLPVPF
jgi:hypothetical protein